jgi:hypothetical protein
VSQRERFESDSMAPGESAMPAVRGEARAPVVRRRRSRARLAGWLFGWLVVLVVLSFFAAYALLPALAKQRTERWLAAELSRPVSIERLRFDPFTLVADIESLRIGRREGEGSLLTVAGAHVDFAWTSLRRRGPVIERLRIDRPALALERSRDGSLDVADLLRRWSEPDASAPAWLGRFSVANIEIEDGSILLDDAAVGQKHRVEALSLKIPFLSSLPVHGTIDVEPSLSALVNGARFTATGQTQPFAEDRSSTLTLDIGTSDVLRYVDYLPVALPWRIVSAQAAARIVLGFAQPPGGTPSLQLSGALAVAGLELAEPDGRPLLSLPGASVELLDYDMQAGRLRIGEVIVSSPRLDWRQAASAEPPSVAGAQVAQGGRDLDWSIARVGIVDGRARVDRRLADGGRLTIDATSVQAEVDEISSDGALPSRFKASAVFGTDETLEIEGRFSHEPLLVSGRFDIRGAGLSRWLAPIEARMPLRVRSGVLDMSGGFEYGEPDAAVAPATASDAWPLHLLAWKSRISGLRLEPLPGGRVPHPQSLESLVADGLSVDFPERRIGFTRARADGLALAVPRQVDGTIDLRVFLEPASRVDAVGSAVPGTAAVTGGATEGAAGGLPGGWRIDPGEFSLGEAWVRLDDVAGGATGQRLEIASFSLGRRGEDGFASLAFDGRVGESASLKALGRFAVDPLRLAVAIDAEGFALLPWRERLEREFGPAGRVAGGTLEAHGSLAYEAGVGGGPVRLSWDGAARVDDLWITAPGTDAELLGVDRLRTDALRLQNAPWRIDAGGLELRGLRARLEISPEGELGLVAADGHPLAASAAASSPSPDRPDWRIAGLRIDDATIEIDDRRHADNPPLGLAGLTGTVGAIAPGVASELALAARLRAGGRLSASGRATMLAPLESLELDAVIDELELATLSPYARRHIGHPLAAGTLEAKLQYRIRGRQLNARHDLVLRDPVFGERVDDAAGEELPLGFALALLRDPRGVVELSLPVAGSLDDPAFSFGERLGGSFLDLVGQVAGKPFVRLAGLVGGSGEQLTHVGFAPGSARLADPASARLGLLARALGERPGLKLRIAGIADGSGDRDALAQHQFERMLKARKLRGQGGGAGNLDAVTIGRGEYPLLVDALFREARLPLPTGRDGRPRDIGVSEKAKALLATVPVGDSQLVDLAQDRAESVRRWLAGQGGIDPLRLEIGEPAVGRTPGSQPAGRVEFGLEAGAGALAQPRESS